ncbi:ferritin-like domain-containing protein [Tricharina praecox]|jgi:hypothetical protein|uniref:ferritin-like domain-containing protein n=1 Tax=Tricharina praecox TaxID=43433 RepID=UPI00221F8A52|nr:ferritin-like domain-containing protein [Tricharina praecox]KAI5857017.1 ferritin-like domain-containing protein [Tricharina praecox]
MRFSILQASGLFALAVRAVPAPQAVTTTESNAMSATGTPGRIPSGNPPQPSNAYPNTGNLTQPEPMPYMPAGGVNTNKSSIPVYQAFSDFDWQSLSLALYQEWIELDLFQAGLDMFSDEDFNKTGIGAENRALIAYMSQQEIGHATLISNMLGPHAPKRCQYQYPFKTVPEFIDFCQKLTRWGEAGVYGFLPHMDSRPAAQMLLQSITTEARQQMIFRQLEGLFPTPEWFQIGVPQSFAWTLLAPYIKSCPADTPKLPWQNFPALNVTNNPQAYDPAFQAALTHNRTQLSHPGREVNFTFSDAGDHVGPNNSYVTRTFAGKPAFAAWISQLNVTYTPLYNVNTTDNNGTHSASAVQPDGHLYSNLNPLVNGTVFVVLTDTDLYVTPHNVSLLLPHVVAGPDVYMAG